MTMTRTRISKANIDWVIKLIDPVSSLHESILGILIFTAISEFLAFKATYPTEVQNPYENSR